MCLKSIDKKIRKNLNSGWKVFYKDRRSENLYFAYHNPYPTNMSTKIKIKNGDITGIWIRDNCPIPNLGTKSNVLYKPGFHFYRTKRAAYRLQQFLTNAQMPWEQRHYEYVMRKVFFKKVIATGRNHDGFVTGVAKEMFICPEGWK